MNWIIRSTSKLRFHTNLEILLVPLAKELKNLKWLVSDLDLNTNKLDILPIGHDKDYYWIDAKQMDSCRLVNPQVVWGSFIAFSLETKVKVTENNIPFIEGNKEIWVSESRQMKDSLIEIVCFDSSYTIVKFGHLELSNKWKLLFDEAIQLDKWKFKK